MVDAALIELEGVLFDTREARAKSIDDALKAQGLETFPAEDRVLGDLVMLRAARLFSKQLATSGALMHDGARSFIDGAASQARLVVVTNASRDDMNTMLRLAGLSDRFALLISADDTLDPKPSPDIYRVAIERLNRRRPTAPASTIALEGSLAGIRAARAAGIRSIAVGALEVHEAIEADAFVESLAGQTIRSLDLLSQPGQERVQ